jgi:hypothetical protein
MTIGEAERVASGLDAQIVNGKSRRPIAEPEW